MSKLKNHYWFEEDFFLAPESGQELQSLLEEIGMNTSVRSSNMDSDFAD